MHVTYNVRNPSENENLLFSIGAHPGFTCPLEAEKESFSDYLIDFGQKEINKLPLYTLDDGLISAQRKTLALVAGKIALDYKLFEKDALILDVAPITHVSVISQKQAKVLPWNFQTLNGWEYGPKKKAQNSFAWNLGMGLPLPQIMMGAWKINWESKNCYHKAFTRPNLRWNSWAKRGKIATLTNSFF